MANYKLKVVVSRCVRGKKPLDPYLVHTALLRPGVWYIEIHFEQRPEYDGQSSDSLVFSPQGGKTIVEVKFPQLRRRAGIFHGEVMKESWYGVWLCDGLTHVSMRTKDMAWTNSTHRVKDLP